MRSGIPAAFSGTCWLQDGAGFEDRHKTKPDLVGLGQLLQALHAEIEVIQQMGHWLQRFVEGLHKVVPMDGYHHFGSSGLDHFSPVIPRELCALLVQRADAEEDHIDLEKARALRQYRVDYARRTGEPTPGAVRPYDDLDYQARSWAKAYRVVLKVEVMAQGDNPRFVVTSLADPSPEALYRDLYCARGQDENFIKAVKNDLASDRTSDHAFLANHLRLFYACAAYSLIHSLRENTLCHTELARAQPMSIILKLFKLAVRVVQYKDRVKLHLSSACPVKGLLQRVSELLYLTHPPPLRS